MHKLLTILLLSIVFSSAQAALIKTGEQISFGFTETDFILPPESTINPDGAQFSNNINNSFYLGSPDDPLYFNGNLEAGEQLQIDFYQNASDTAIFKTYTLDGSSSIANNTFLFLDTTLWQDMEGKVIFSMLNGDADIGYTSIIIYKNSLAYSLELSPTTVPLPASFWLLSLGLLALGRFQRK